MWRTVKQKEYGASRYDIVIRAEDYPDRNIRITVEEEVNECCEKWRRKTGLSTATGKRVLYGVEWTELIS